MKLDKITQGYLECALWSSGDQTDDQGGTPLDENYSFDDIDLDSLEQMENDCRKFLELAESTIPNLLDDNNLEKLGHDFWLTRNHHGAGFWDGDYNKEVGEKLTELSHKFKECVLYVGDDNKLYLY